MIRNINYLENLIPYELRKLEQEPVITTNQNHEYDDYEEDLFYQMDDYLYHGIRFQNYLEKLENIFNDRKILAGKYLPNYRFYSDNCNLGEYVSLLKYIDDTAPEYEIFVLQNISLLVTPLCDAIETKYVDYQTWEEIQKKQYELKHVYSYMRGECLCKDYIPLDMVKAVGVPYQKLFEEGKEEYAVQIIDDIKKLMDEYKVNIPIVDTSRYNRILYKKRIEDVEMRK